MAHQLSNGAVSYGRVSTGAANESVTSARRYLDHFFRLRGLTPVPLPPTCILCYSSPMVSRLLARFHHTSLEIGWSVPLDLHVVRQGPRVRYGLVRGHAGAPMAAALLEELIALGFRRFITVGAAGHPADGMREPLLRVGDLVLPEAALIQEGTSRHYVTGRAGSHDMCDARVLGESPPLADSAGPALAFPHLPSLAALKDLLTSRGARFHPGRVVTTDAIYRETDAFIDRALREDALAIDMELSALFTVAAFHGVSLVSLMFISDIVHRAGTWELPSDPGPLLRAQRRMLPVVLEYARGHDPD